MKSASPLIAHALCIGDARPYNVALLVVDPEAAAGLGDADAVEDEVAAAVERANGRLSRVEQPRRFTLLAEEWLPDSDVLTPTMKLKRRGVLARYAGQIEAMYAGNGVEAPALPDPARV